MVAPREKPKRILLRPMLRLFLVFGAVALLFGSGGRWRIAAIIVIVLFAAIAIISRIVSRRVAHAREPDPQSTLKI